MMPDSSSSVEADRLAALRSYCVMDTDQEQALDDLTALARQICETPISLVSLVDETRQWFKARVGLDLVQTPREVSFCAHALHQTDLLVVPDATQDPRFANNPLVRGEPGVRFYAGAPLITPTGYVLGTLCVVDRIPRTLSPGQELALRVLARQVVTHLELHRQSRERVEGGRLLQTIYDASPDSMTLLGLDGTVRKMNKAGLQFMEADSFEEIEGQCIYAHHAPELQERMKELFSRIARGESAAIEFQKTGRKGTQRWLETHAAPFRDEHGTVTAIVTVTRDITDRKHSEARFHWLVDSNAQGVMYWNEHGGIVGANDAFLTTVGYSREDLEAGQLDWKRLTPPELAARDERATAEQAATGICIPYEKEYIRKDGTRVPVLIGSAASADNPGEGVCFTVDLTQRKELEKQFLRMQRMEAINTLSAGLAHDLNNTFGPIVTGMELLRHQFPDTESQELLDLIRASAQRGVDIVRQVLSFARGAEIQRMEIDVKDVLREIQLIVRETFQRKIRIRVTVSGELWRIVGDATQLHQVMLNLCLNARDAMPNGGTISLSAENLIIDPFDTGLNPEAQAGRYVVLHIEDDGTGMPPETVARIYDPFFTTKEPGIGTGLGLTSTLGIVKSHGGFMRVESKVGEGTVFRIFLPALTSPAASQEGPAEAELPRGNGELVLLVDDEAGIREITGKTLVAFGYRCLSAPDGPSAFAALASHPEEVAVAIIDMNMPIFDGPATIQVLRRMKPSLSMILSSGRRLDLEPQTLGIEHILPKPYTAAGLLNVLQLVLHPTNRPQVLPAPTG